MRFCWLTFEGWRICGIKAFTRMLQYQSKAYTFRCQAPPPTPPTPASLYKFNLYSTSTTPAHPIYGRQSIEVHSLGCWQSHKNLGLSIIDQLCMVVGVTAIAARRYLLSTYLPTYLPSYRVWVEVVRMGIIVNCYLSPLTKREENNKASQTWWPCQ